MKKQNQLHFLYDLVYRLPRRLRFVISSVVMTILMVTSTFFEFQYAWIIVPVLIVAAFLFTYLAVLEGISKIEIALLFVMPVLFTVSVYFFYFLFPVRWLTRLPLIFIYGVSIYAILLTSNIFNVGVEKNIQLYRAGFSVNYLFQTLVIFLATEALLSFRLPFFGTVVLIFLIILLLGVQLLWSVQPTPILTKNVMFHGFILALVIAEVALLFTFAPIRTTMFSLLVTATYYSLSGLMYHYFDNKLFRQTIREYIFVLIFVFVLVLLTIPW